MKKSLLALAFVAATLAPLASASAATVLLSTDVSSPTPLTVSDIGSVAGINQAGFLDSTGAADYYFDFVKPGTATSYLGNLDFVGFGPETATVSLVGGSSFSSITAPTIGSIATGQFSITSGAEYKLAISGTPNAAFVANITDVSAVPEPAAWALMLAGFGGLGLALRNTRRKNAALVAA